MGVVVSFNYSTWVALFPQFAYLSQAQATQYFNLATQYVRNDGGGPVCTAAQQSALLNLVTAHLAQIFAPTAAGGAPPNIVGRISSASEGSVSVSTENQYPPGTAQWWQQTPAGSAAWEMMKPYRTMRMIVGPVYNPDPFPVYGQYWLGGPGGWW